jgi:uncharacterized protein YqkB
VAGNWFAIKSAAGAARLDKNLGPFYPERYNKYFYIVTPKGEGI